MAIRKQEGKKKRIPVSGRRDVLTASGKEKGYTYRWVNDDGSRIPEFKEGGYEAVIDRSMVIGDSSTSSPSTLGAHITKNVGQGVTAHLMRIKDEFYQEDQIAKARVVDQKEESLKEDMNKLSGAYGSGLQGNR